MDDSRGAEPAGGRDAVRERIIAAATDLLAQGGREATTTRAVATAANVQAPTLYRLFGDMQGLLAAVAQHGLASYIADKAAWAPHPDPVQDLRDGWDLHVAFGLAHPALFAIMNGETLARETATALTTGREVLARRIRAIAASGRLRVNEARAVALLQAVGRGTVLTLLGEPAERRDPGLSAAAREAVIAAITTATPAVEMAGPAAAAITLRAVLGEGSALSSAERGLLEVWLERLGEG